MDGVSRVDKVMLGQDIQFLPLTVLHMYRVIIISDSDRLLLLVGLFIVLIYLTNLTTQRTPELPREVTN